MGDWCRQRHTAQADSTNEGKKPDHRRFSPPREVQPHRGVYFPHGYLEMFMTPALAVSLIAMKFLMGAVIGIVVGALLCWPRFSIGLAVRSALLGGFAFLLASEIAGWRGIAGWAASSVYFSNGKRLDVAPDRESLWLRNRIAEHEIALALVSSCGAALLAGLHLKRNREG
jgi:hypothetical protein